MRWRAVLQNSSWYMLERVLRLAGSFLVSAWVARYLGPSEYGMLAFAVALTAMAAFLVSLGVESIVVRDLVQHPDREADILSTYFSLRLVGGVLGPLGACAYVYLTDPDNRILLSITAILGTGTLLTAMDLVDGALQARHRARTTSAARAIAFVASSGAKCALILSGATLIWFAVATIVESIFTAAIYTKILRSLRINLSLRRFDPAEMKSFLHDGRYMILSGVAVTIYSKIDVIVIGSVISTAVLANYAIAAAMLAAWNMLGQSFAQAIGPHIAASHARCEKEYREILRRFLTAMLILAVVGSTAISLLSNIIFDVLLGPAYTSGAEVLKILIWASVPTFLGVATSQIIVNERLYRLSLLRTALGMICTLTLVIPIARQFGADGVAYLVIASSSVATASLLFSRRARRVLGATLSRRSRPALEASQSGR